MKKSINELTRTLFFKIETVSQSANFSLLSESMKNFWNIKSKNLTNHPSTTIKEIYEDKAALSSEFGKIICISVGSYFNRKGSLVFRTKSFYGLSEKSILKDFSNLLVRHYNDSTNVCFVGHNIREFTIPFLCRRMIINGLKIPKAINNVGKKPWEINYIRDTLDLWKFGEFKHSISLSLLCEVLDIDVPHQYVEGSKIGEYYWKHGNIDIITRSSEIKLGLVSKVYRRIMEVDIPNSKYVHLQKVS